jgi:putative transposase
VLEDLNIGGMLKNHKLARAISQVWRGMFKDILTYKCEWYWKTLLTIWRFEPSSKMCCECWNIKQDLTLKDRIYKCEKCWSEHDRDIGASKNIKDFAFKQ